jgi:hypothetical protein
MGDREGVWIAKGAKKNESAKGGVRWRAWSPFAFFVSFREFAIQVSFRLIARRCTDLNHV